MKGITIKIATLQRRRDHLGKKLADTGTAYRSTSSANYDKAEIDALDTAIEVMAEFAERFPERA